METHMALSPEGPGLLVASGEWILAGQGNSSQETY
jgi:hypothetical protein